MTEMRYAYLLPDILACAAAKTPSATGLTDGVRELTFQELDDAAARLAAHLRKKGAATGDRVIVFMANSIEFVLAFWAVSYCGAVVVPINADTKAQKLAWILADCQPHAIIADADLADVVREASIGAAPYVVLNGTSSETSKTTLQDLLADTADIDRERPADLDQNLAAIIYTSGSTGKPKGVMLSHLNMLTAARSVAQYLDYRPTDRIFCAVPLTFDYGLHQVTMSALTGACLIVERSFARPLFSLHRLAKAGGTVFPVVPSMVALIEPLADRVELSSLRIITNTASALSERQIRLLLGMFPTARIFSMYGLTECHRCTYLPPELLASRPGSVGRAIPNTELWIVDDEGVSHRKSAVGELVIRGSTVMKGYWQNPEQTARKLKPGPLPGEMVLHTGDICRLDDDGLLYFVARKDDVLKVNGEKVAPREVEDVLLSHPSVLQAAVLGEHDAVRGHRILAFVESRTPEGCSLDDLLRWCRDRLESYMVPSEIRIMENLPRNNNGKIDKLALSSLPAAKLDFPRPITSKNSREKDDLVVS